MLITSAHAGLYSPITQVQPTNRKPVESPIQAAEKSRTIQSVDAQKNTQTASEQIIRPPSVRSSFAIDPAQELKPLHLDQKHTQISKTFLDIAHYEETFQLVDVFA